MSRDSERRSPPAGSLGFMLAALVVIGTVLGYFADRWLHTKPWLMVAGVFVGAGLGFVYMVLILFADSSSDRGRMKKGGADEGPGAGPS